MPIDAFIFTKDRACQLRLLLESFHRNCPGLFRPCVLWKTSNNEYKAGYQKLFRDSVVPRNTEWDMEVRHVREHFVEAMHTSRQRGALFCIYTDDCIFFRQCKAKVEDIERGLDTDTICFSFRLGFNTTIQDYRTGYRQPPLTNWTAVQRGQDGPTLVWWKWRQYGDTLNYGYPIAMDGCCYRPEDLLALTEGWDFDTFRTWEGSSNGPPRRDKIKKPAMCCFDASCVVNVPANSMQWPPLAAGSFHPYSAEDLNRRYLDGWVIDLDAFDFSGVQGCHQEFPLKFKKA